MQGKYFELTREWKTKGKGLKSEREREAGEGRGEEGEEKDSKGLCLREETRERQGRQSLQGG